MDKVGREKAKIDYVFDQVTNMLSDTLDLALHFDSSPRHDEFCRKCYLSNIDTQMMVVLSKRARPVLDNTWPDNAGLQEKPGAVVALDDQGKFSVQ
jgi:hypothetical protein